MKRIHSHALAGMVAVHLGAFATAAVAEPHQINHCKTIAQSGSYVVNKNLNAIGNCLVVQAEFVTIDLDGFAITGNGTGYGVSDEGGNPKAVTLRNGTVSNFFNGINLSGPAVIERMSSIDNTNVGIIAFIGSIVRDSIAIGNANMGIAVGPGSLVTGSVSNRNYDGIVAGYGSTITGSTVGFNTHNGMRVYTGTISNNTSWHNPDWGIYAECPSAVIGNTATGNGTNLSLVGAGCVSEHNAAP